VIAVDYTQFPYNAVNLIAARAQTLDADLFVTKRPLRESDPIQSIGVFGQQWMPDEDSYEMRGLPGGVHQPTLSSYLLGIQAFVKDGDEERGAATHGTLSKMVRTMLVNDPTLRVGLRSLSVTTSGSTERTQRFAVRTQRYLSNELSGSWLYLSTIELWLETETS
jgi:hypothetical protein